MGRKQERQRESEDDGRSSPEIESLNCCQLKVHQRKIKQQMNKHHLDPTYNGPLKNRSCTDIICLLLFIICIAAWVALGVYAFTRGPPGEIFAPRDSNGRKCGYDEGFEKKPNLVFFDLTQCFIPTGDILKCNTPQVCVEKCPEENFYFDAYLDSSIPFLKEKMICQYGIDLSRYDTYDQLKQLVENKDCALYYLESASVAGRCLPDLTTLLDTANGIIIEIDTGMGSIDNVTVQGVTGEAIDSGSYIVQALSAVNEFWQSVAKDLLETWPWILISIIAAMVLSLIYIVLMRWIAGLMVWFSLIAVIALLSYCSYISFEKYLELRNLTDNTSETREKLYQPLIRARALGLVKEGSGISGAIQDQINSYLRMKDTWLAFFIIAVSILLILLLIIIFLRNRIRLAISLINEGSRAVSTSWSTLFFPIFPWIVQIAVVSYGVVICLYLFSSGIAVYKVAGLPEGVQCNCPNNMPPLSSFHNGDICNPDNWNTTCATRPDCANSSCLFMSHDSHDYTVYLQLYNLFIFFWALFFVGAVGQMILASTFATYYWTYDKSKLPFFMVFSGAWRVFRYHLGTAAFGSLLLAIVNWIRVLLEMSDAYLKKYDNQFVRAIKCCMKCFFWCLEKFLRFLNKNAYIMCAVHGKNFCVSAKNAFSLLLRNILRVFVLDKVTDFLFFISKLVITGAIGAASFYLFSRPVLNIHDLSARPYESTYTFVPIVFTIIGTYFVTSIFFNVYSMAVDTLFLCFLEDCDINDGSETKPYFMTKNLMKILGKKNK